MKKQRKGGKRTKEHFKKKERKKSMTMKTNESLKLWWEELMNINFYYSDYKIHFKIGWNTFRMFCQGRSWQLQSQENYNSIRETLLKTTWKKQIIWTSKQTAWVKFYRLNILSSADCTHMLQSSNNGAIRYTAIFLPGCILPIFLLVNEQQILISFSI